MGAVNPDDLDISFAEEESGLAWGVEVSFPDVDEKSVFFSARKVVLDGDCAQIQLLDGTYETFAIERVRKVLAMRADPPSGYTEDLIADELY